MLWMALLTLFLDSGLVARLEPDVRSNVDLIELNTHLSDTGKFAYEQIILWRWDPSHRRHEVIAWFLVNNASSLPRKYGDRWRVEWLDEGKTRRSIVSKMYRESTTGGPLIDPERLNKKLVEEKYRERLPVLIKKE